MNWTRWSWLRDLFLPLALVLLRVCLLWLWLWLLRRWLLPSYGGVVLPGGLMLGLVVTSLGISRVGSRLEGVGETAVRLFVALLGVGVVVVSQWWLFHRAEFGLWQPGWLQAWGDAFVQWEGEPPPSYLALPFVFYLWLRGIVVGSQQIEHKQVMRTFMLGCVGLVLFGLLLAASDLVVSAAVGGVIFLFFGVAMVALALSSAKTERVMTQGKGEQQIWLSRYWVTTALLVIGVLLGVGTLLSALIAPETLYVALQWVGGMTTELMILLIKGISFVLYPLILLLYRLLMPLVRAIFDGDRFELPEQPASEGLRWLPEPEAVEQGMAGLGAEWRWLLGLFFLLLLGVVFGVALRRLLADEVMGEVDEERVFVFTNELLQAQLAGWLPDWLGGARGKRPFSLYLSLDAEPEPRRAVRQLYQQFLAWLVTLGNGRLPHQTPLQLAQQLPPPLAAELEAVATLTSGYNQARYGADPPTAQQAAAVAQAWRQLAQRQAELADES